MTSDAVLVLAWLVLAHLVADFVLQTDGMVADKRATGRRGWRGLLTHGAMVALCLAPFVLAYGQPGLVVLVGLTLSHVVVDRWKIRATRRVEARALASAHRRHEGTDVAPDVLGSAWTPAPAALFVLDQLVHLALIGVAWVGLVQLAEPTAPWREAIDRLIGGFDRAELHRWAMLAVVGLSLLIVNVRAGALFVATLVRPREAVGGERPPVAPRAREGEPTVEAPRAWRVRVGPIEGLAEPIQPRVPAAATATAPVATSSHASPARIGATIGILERLLIVTFVLTGSTAAIGFVVAAKTLARFKQLDDRDFAEYYLLGTLASVAVALASALLAQAALGTLPDV